MRKCEFVFVLRPNFIKTLISFLVSKLKNKKIKTAKELTTSRTFIFFFFRDLSMTSMQSNLSTNISINYNCLSQLSVN